MKKKSISIFLICCLSAALSISNSGCAPMRTSSKTEIILGTIINVTLYGTTSQQDLDTAAQAALDRAEELDEIFSATSDTSELSYVNQNAYKEPVEISQDLYTVLERSLYFAKLPDGAFDPTLGRLIKLWGIGTDHAKVPDDEEIEPLIHQKNYENILLNEEEHTIRFTKDDFELDLGAIAKGYAADQMKQLLINDYGITCGLLNLGGNIITIGERYDNHPWNVGIADPKNPQDSQNPAVLLKISDQTMVTSGNYQRYFTDSDGTIYHHILDSTTGRPADTGLSSVTIISDCSMDADALSTACFVLGETKALQLLDSLENTQAVFISTDQQVTATQGIKNQLESGTLTVSLRAMSPEIIINSFLPKQKIGGLL